MTETVLILLLITILAMYLHFSSEINKLRDEVSKLRAAQPEIAKEAIVSHVFTNCYSIGEKEVMDIVNKNSTTCE